jgi:predicted Zn-dependent protease
MASFSELKTNTPVSNDPKINAMVQRVGKRIAAVADLPNAQREFVVFDSKEANAFCLPGGKVGVFTGLMPIAKDEAGLATVIGHEVAHASLHHGAERVSRSMAAQGLGELLNAGVSAYDPKWQKVTSVAFGLGTQVGVELPHSRAQESEADRVGLRYMARAGYNPEEAVNFWQRFAAHTGKAGGGPSFLRTHPVDSVRIKQLKQWLPEAKAQYRAQ